MKMAFPVKAPVSQILPEAYLLNSDQDRYHQGRGIRVCHNFSTISNPQAVSSEMPAAQEALELKIEARHQKKASVRVSTWNGVSHQLYFQTPSYRFLSQRSVFYVFHVNFLRNYLSLLEGAWGPAWFPMHVGPYDLVSYGKQVQKALVVYVLWFNTQLLPQLSHEHWQLSLTHQTVSLLETDVPQMGTLLSVFSRALNRFIVQMQSEVSLGKTVYCFVGEITFKASSTALLSAQAHFCPCFIITIATPSSKKEDYFKHFSYKVPGSQILSETHQKEDKDITDKNTDK